jgi:histidinol-phosphate/aromatic aminotransferase/cobyric acid decarboxylase-like protein
MGEWFEQRISALKRLAPYQFAFDLNAENVRVKLDANENWHIPRERLRKIVAEAAEEVDVRKYPLGCAHDLAQAVAKQLRFQQNQLFPLKAPTKESTSSAKASCAKPREL